MWHKAVIPTIQKAEAGRTKPAWAKLVRHYLKKQNTNKRGGQMAQVVKHLPTMQKAFSSIPSTTN
jgi:hypothetical protein